MKLDLYIMVATEILGPDHQVRAVGGYAEVEQFQIRGGASFWIQDEVDYAKVFEPFLSFCEQYGIKKVNINLEAEQDLPQLKALLKHNDPEALLNQLKKKSGVPQWALNLVEMIKKTEVKFKPVGKIGKRELEGVIKADGVTDILINRTKLALEPQLMNEVFDIDNQPKAKASKPALLPDSVVFDLGREDGVYHFGNTDMTKSASKKDQNHEDERRDKSYVYYNGTPTRLRKMGSYNTDERYSVAIMKEPIPYLDGVFAHQRQICRRLYNDIVPMTVYRMDAVYGKRTVADFEEGNFGNVGYTTNGSMYQIVGQRADISWVVNPPVLTFAVRRALGVNERLLRRFIDNDLDLCLTDITENLYAFNAKGAVIMNPDVASSSSELKLEGVKIPDGRTVNIKALFKVDMPSYQHFKRLCKTNPKVHILTRMDDQHIVGYSFIIETDEGWLHYAPQHAAKHTLRTLSKRNRKK